MRTIGMLGGMSWESTAEYYRLANVLGCTEIELLVGADDSPVPVFPTTRLHVEAAVDLALCPQRGSNPRPMD